MPLPIDAPAWAAELALAYESGAHGQFLLYGNVHDRFPLHDSKGERLVNLYRWLEAELLAGFAVLFSYDLGNGLRIERGGELLQEWPGGRELLEGPPREPLAAVEAVGRYLRYLANLHDLGRAPPPAVACLLRGADQLLPGGPAWGREQGALTTLVRDWAGEPPFADLPFASFLIADNLADLHPLIAYNPRTLRLRLPLPEPAALERALRVLQTRHPAALPASADLPATAATLAGVTVAAVEGLVKRRAHQGAPLAAADLMEAKKGLVEREAGGLVEFIESRRTLADYYGQPALKETLRQDMALWRAGDLRALPKGYLICGPVGTGKSFLVECLAGEAGVPVVKLKNFRDRWVGSSEGNLEKIFRLVRGLGRCLVFIDEADQSLGRRDVGAGDSGLSGRLYAMLAEEMGAADRRGRSIWLLASSRPDLIEVDLKRPGRVDLKVPILPTVTAAEGAALLGALFARYDLPLSAEELAAAGPAIPTLLTPGAAEALAVKAYRLARLQRLAPAAALTACLADYQPPVPPDLLEAQMRIAIREASDLAFVPPALRHLAAAEGG